MAVLDLGLISSLLFRLSPAGDDGLCKLASCVTLAI